MSNQLIKPDIISIPTQETEFSISELKQALRKQWKAAVVISTAAFAGIFLSSITQAPKYQSETLILLHNQKAVSVVPELLPQEASNYNKNYATEIQILRSYALISRAISQYKDTFKSLSLGQVSQNLSISQAGDADVLIVSYKDTDPQRAKGVLEALNSTYVDYSLERQRSQATNAIKFIKEQLPKAQKELNGAASEIRNFRQQNEIVNPEVYAETVDQVRQSLEQQAQETIIEISSTQSQYQDLSKQLENVGKSSENSLGETILGEDTVYQTLSTQLKELEAKYAIEKTRFYDNFPIVEDLKLQQQELQRLLQERTQQVLGRTVSQVDINRVTKVGVTQQNLANQLLQVGNKLATLKSKLAAIRRAQVDADRDFQTIPRIQQSYAELQRELTLKAQAVDNFLGKLQELKIAEAQEIAPWQIIEPPYLPITPVSPNTKRSLIMALIVGGLSGIGAAYLLQRLDQRVKQVEEIKQLAGLSLLGTIPKVEQPFIRPGATTNEQLHTYEYSYFTEAFRSLAMSLRYLMIETGRIKMLALTSATSSEGKTTVTYNLGLVLAELGLKVLVVDADMRKPRIHKLAKQPNDMGLSNAIAQDKPWSEFVRVGQVENLHIITSGPSSPNPVALLSSEKMRQLMHQWRQAYDYILIDTPPIGLMADAQSIVDRVDSVIYVAGIERVTRRGIKSSLEVLRASKCNVAGLVANFVDSELDDYQNYHSYYSEHHHSSSNGNGDPTQNEKVVNNFLSNFRRRQ